MSQRKPAMDIIRCFALLFVVSVHFFLHNGFYDRIVDGPRMYIMTAMRAFFMICVPLFIVLSGYLTSSKTLTRNYYRKIGYTIAIYVLASLCCVGYKVFFCKETFTLLQFIRGFFNFSNAPYAWYVELYLGLFLLTPLLNTLYNNLKSKKEKQVLLATFLLLTSLPHAVNIIVPESGWFANPASSRDYFKLLPTYWTCLYPITYYFIGCYLREFGLHLSTRKNLLLSALLFLLNGALNCWYSHGSIFIKGPWQENGSALIVVQTVLFFCLFDNLDYTKFSATASAFLKRISGLCFGAYLLSWIFDDLFYQVLNSRVTVMPLRLNFFPLIVPLIYVCSLATSFLINKLYDLCAKWFLVQLCKSRIKVS